MQVKANLILFLNSEVFSILYTYEERFMIIGRAPRLDFEAKATRDFSTMVYIQFFSLLHRYVKTLSDNNLLIKLFCWTRRSELSFLLRLL
jgi:hypothetical protein